MSYKNHLSTLVVLLPKISAFLMQYLWFYAVKP